MKKEKCPEELKQILIEFICTININSDDMYLISSSIIYIYSSRGHYKESRLLSEEIRKREDLVNYIRNYGWLKLQFTILDIL